MGAEAVKEEVVKGRREAQGEAHKPPVVVVFVAAYLLLASGHIVFRVDERWYDSLIKPPWALPSIVVEAIWFVMFGVLAYTSVLVFRDAGGTPTAHAVLAFRIAHLFALQAFFYLLFQRKVLLPAAIDATLLSITTLGIALTAALKQRLAARLLGVYFLWVFYDTALTWGLWTLNR